MTDKMKTVLIEVDIPKGAKIKGVRYELPGFISQDTTQFIRIISRDDELVRVRDERDRLDALINNAHTDDFLESVRLEAAHQVERWGEAHDRGKSAENWFWLVGYLAGKALRAAIIGDREKALHHCISSGAALLNWHKAIKCDATGTSVGDDRDLVEIARFEMHDTMQPG